MSETQALENQTPDEGLLDDEISAAGGQRPVMNFLSEVVVYVDSTDSVRDIAVRLRSADVSLAVVGNAERVLGVVSERDIVRAVALDIDLDETVVDVIETDDLKWATVDSTVDDVAEEMLENYLRHVLVGHDDGTLAGVVSMRDLLAAHLV